MSFCLFCKNQLQYWSITNHPHSYAIKAVPAWQQLVMVQTETSSLTSSPSSPSSSASTFSPACALRLSCIITVNKTLLNVTQHNRIEIFYRLEWLVSSPFLAPLMAEKTEEKNNSIIQMIPLGGRGTVQQLMQQEAGLVWWLHLSRPFLLLSPLVAHWPSVQRVPFWHSSSATAPI